MLIEPVVDWEELDRLITSRGGYALRLTALRRRRFREAGKVTIMNITVVDPRVSNWKMR
ncbi:MAG: hypothetical protein ACR2JR_08305 [Rubrobacteraceae bacterium]